MKNYFKKWTIALCWAVLGIGIPVLSAGAEGPTIERQLEPNFAPVSVGTYSKNFMLIGLDGLGYEYGRAFELNRVSGKVLVLYFTGIDCAESELRIQSLFALSKEYQAKGATFWVVDSRYKDTIEALRQEMWKMRVFPLPALIDDTQGVAHMLGVTRTATAVVLSLPDRKIIYRGAVESASEDTSQTAESPKHYLQDALDQALRNEQVTISETTSGGRVLQYVPVNSPGTSVSYSKQVAPIIDKKCTACHSPGNVAPFSFTSYQVARAMSPMIEEVILAKRMPPWQGDPHFGSFKNDISLSLLEKRTMLQWIHDGAENDLGLDPLDEVKNRPPRPKWPFGKPDYVVSMPRQETPATGALGYRYLKVTAPFDKDVWVGALAVVPGNPKILHHILVYRVSAADDAQHFTLEKSIGGWVPGFEGQPFLKDAGWFVPKGSAFVFEAHYITTGKPEIDDATQMGLYLLKKPPKYQLAGILATQLDINLPPQQSDVRTFATAIVNEDVILYRLDAHMHLRGRSMRFDMIFPPGKRETLLSVPNYNFYWQREYLLERPRKIPAGSVLIVSGSFDNSSLNPLNPDPNARVHYGLQSYEEMFDGFMQVGVLRDRGSAKQETAKRSARK